MTIRTSEKITLSSKLLISEIKQGSRTCDILTLLIQKTIDFDSFNFEDEKQHVPESFTISNWEASMSKLSMKLGLGE